MPERRLQPPPLQAIAIGGSAGGVEALGAILPKLPAACPVPVFVVIHLPPSDRSLLAPLFAPRCALRVVEVQDGEPIQPATIYFAPPAYHLLIDSPERCALSQEDAVHYSRPSIDLLFESAAWTYRGGTLGVLLSGANADGVDGLAAIRAAGGRAWVQSPEGAVAEEMPRAALARGAFDRVLALPDLAEALATAVEREGLRTA